MNIPFIDLKTQYARIKDKVKPSLEAVLDHGMYVMGPENRELEARLAEYTGAKHCLACASGTDALIMGLLALGIGQGDAVFTTPFTFVATAESIALMGATPVFADIRPDTFNMDPAKLEAAIIDTQAARPELTPKAIIAVDIFGQAADYEAIQAIADKYDLELIVDAAQSFGTTQNGTSTCTLGTMATTSFFPAKPLGCYGDGGAVFTNDDKLLDILDSVRVHGQGKDKYENIRLGITGRLDTMQAAVLLAKMDIFDEEMKLRQEVAGRYTELLADVDGIDAPHVDEGNVSAWAQYSILSRNEKHRSELMGKLAENSVPSAIYYPIQLHMQKAFADLGYRAGDMPVSEDIGSRIFSLPMHPYLEAETQEYIVSVLKGEK